MKTDTNEIVKKKERQKYIRANSNERSEVIAQLYGYLSLFLCVCACVHCAVQCALFPVVYTIILFKKQTKTLIHNTSIYFVCSEWAIFNKNFNWMFDSIGYLWLVFCTHTNRTNQVSQLTTFSFVSFILFFFFQIEYVDSLSVYLPIGHWLPLKLKTPK